jgi:hypothetical protein
MNMRNANRLLKTALISNAIFSMISGMLLICLNGFFIVLFKVSHFQFWPIGVGLTGFSILVFSIGLKHFDNSKKIMPIIISDVVWVIASVFVLLTRPLNISFEGYRLIAIIAVIVGGFCVLQYLGIKTIKNRERQD